MILCEVMCLCVLKCVIIMCVIRHFVIPLEQNRNFWITKGRWITFMPYLTINWFSKRVRDCVCLHFYSYWVNIYRTFDVIVVWIIYNLVKPTSLTVNFLSLRNRPSDIITVPSLRSQLFSSFLGLCSSVFFFSRKCDSYKKIHGNIINKISIFTTM